MFKPLKKYLPVLRNTWTEYTVYRLNFVLWRVRTLLQLMTIYFLWSAIFAARSEIFGYSQRQILTYILLSQVLAATAFSTRTPEVGNEINSGDLSNFLLKPLNYFRYWWARDIADKSLNIVFAVVEISALILIFNPQLFLQTDYTQLAMFAVSVFLSAVLYFYISFLLALSGFWTPDVWAPRFLFFIITDFFSGRLFPLDILPKAAFEVLNLLPFAYLQYFPLKVYLGDITGTQAVYGIGTTLFWIGISYAGLRIVWSRGLLRYEAQGR